MADIEMPPDVASEALAAQIIQAVAELPDRTSPPDWPEAMLVTQDELFDIVCDVLKPGMAKDAR